MMTGKEKLYFLLNRIDDVRAIAPSGQPLVIDPTNDLNQNYRDVELKQLFTKLEKDEQVLKVLQVPSWEKTVLDKFDPYNHADDGCWHIELLPAFDSYFLKIQQESEYQEFTGEKPPAQKNTIKPNRRVLEKIWNTLQEIEEKRQLGTENAPIILEQFPYGNESVGNWDDFYEERKNIIQKLLTLNAIKNLEEGQEGAWNYWKFDIGNNYFDVFSQYGDDYKNAAQEYQQNKMEEKADIKDIAYEVKYSEKSREILINNFLLAKPDFNSENEVVFSYLYQNANRPVKTEELEQQLGNKLKKPIHNILRDLGFTGKFAKVFFGASKSGVVFRNPITYQDLKDLGIERIKIQEKK